MEIPQVEGEICKRLKREERRSTRDKEYVRHRNGTYGTRALAPVSSIAFIVCITCERQVDEATQNAQEELLESGSHIQQLNCL